MATILLVEDNPANLKLATLVLRNVGHAILQAFDGDQALRMVREQMPDLVLMDLHMPGMDGLTATRILKSDPATAHIPILALTAHAMHGDQERIIAAGCDGYIAKPFQLQEFLSQVEQALQTKPPGS